MLADDFFGAIAFDALCACVPACDDTLRIQSQDGVIHYAFNHQPRAFFASPQICLYSLALGDIGGDHQARISLAEEERVRYDLDGDEVSIFLAMGPGAAILRRRAGGCDVLKERRYIFLRAEVLDRQG